MRYISNQTTWFCFSWLLLISCHKPADNTPLPNPPAAPCKITKIVMAQSSQMSDTAFFEDGLIKEIKGDSVYVKFKLGGGWLQQKEEYSKTNILFRRTYYGEFFGKMSWESMNDYPNLTSLANRHKEYVWVFDNLSYILYFNTERSTPDFTWKINFVYNGDGNIQSASQYDTTGSLVATYNFTYDRDSMSAFRSIFAYNFDFYFADASPYHEAIKAALIFSNSRLIKVGSSIPGFTPLDYVYTGDKNRCRSISINNQPAYVFRYSCD